MIPIAFEHLIIKKFAEDYFYLPKTTSAETYDSYNIYSSVHINLSLWVLHHDCKEHFFTIQLFVRTVDFEFPKKISKTIL